MARRHASIALAAIIVIARLIGSGAAAAATSPSEESIRADLGHRNAPSRSLRSPHGAHGRAVARNSSLGAWLASMPLAIEDPPRTLVPPSMIPLTAPVAALPPPASQARAPPR